MDSVKNLQYITHVALINVVMVAHTEIFVTQLMEITSFDLVDVSDYVTEVFDLTESEPIN